MCLTFVRGKILAAMLVNFVQGRVAAEAVKILSCPR